MERQWRIRRQTSPRLDGQQRWDRAYQLLLSWTEANPLPLAQVTNILKPITPEADHANTRSALCSGLDHPSSTDPNP